MASNQAQVWQPSEPGDRLHVYTDADGTPLFEVCRRTTPDGKRMFVRCPDPAAPSGYRNSLEGVEARPLYRLPAVLAAVEQERAVHLVAGEKIADELAALGLVATTNPFGESGELRPEHVEALRGARIAVWVDSDAPGRARGSRAVEQLREVAYELRGPIDVAPGRDDGYDLADILEAMRATEASADEMRSRVAAFVERAQDVPTGPLLSIVVESLADSLDNEPPEPEWIWRGFLAPSWITLLAGGPKTGKTTLLFALLDALATGAPLFGLDTRSTGVLILTEQNPSVLRSTVDNFGFRFDREHVRVMYRRRQPADLTWQELIDQAVMLCKREGLGLLVVDTFQRWAGMERDNDAPETLAAITALERAAESGLSVLVNHHHRKAGGQHGEEVSGPVALAAGMDVIVGIRRQPSAGENVRKITADGRSTVTPPELTVRLEDGRYELVEDYTQTSVRTVAAALKDGPAGYDELAERTGIPRRSVERAIRRLRESGDVTEAKEGHRKVFALIEAEQLPIAA